MTNTFNTIQSAAGVIAKAAAQTLKDNMKFASNIDQADASDFDGKNGYKSGDTIKVSVPARYTPQDSFDITSSIQDSVEEKRDLKLDLVKTVGMQFGAQELATEVGLKQIINRFVVPAAESIAQYAEQEFIKRATQATYNLAGTAGSTAFTPAEIGNGRTKLDQMLAPQGDRMFLLNSAAAGSAVDQRKALYNASGDVSKQYRDGVMMRADGFDWMQTELLYTHTNGADVTGVALTAVPSEGASTIAVNGLTTSTTGIVKKGSVFTIAGVYKVHPITRTSTGVLQQFVVTADADSDSSGAATVSVSPALYTSSSKSLQNIAAMPTSTAALTFVGSASTSYAQNLMFHKNAFKMVSVPLELPTAVEFAAQETVDGITVAVVRSFDVLQRRMITRLDFLGGISAVRPEWACRMTA